MELFSVCSNWRANTTGKDAADSHYTVFDKSLEAVNADVAVVLVSPG